MITEFIGEHNINEIVDECNNSLPEDFLIIKGFGKHAVLHSTIHKIDMDKVDIITSYKYGAIADYVTGISVKNGELHRELERINDI